MIARDFSQGQVDQPVIWLRLFGAIEAWDHSGEDVLPRGRKAQAILSYLALATEEVIPRKRLAGLLWSTRWSSQAQASLRQSLIEIRRALGRRHHELISIERDRIIFKRALVWVDGLSAQADPQSGRSSVHSPHPDRLLETLVGLDPKYDEWIASVRVDVARLLGARRRNAQGTDSERIDIPTDPRAIVPSLGETGIRAAINNVESPTRGDDYHPRSPIISILPFLQFGAARFDCDVSLALSHEIATALARFRWFRVRLGQSDDRGEGEYGLDGYTACAGMSCRLVVRLLDQSDRSTILWTFSETFDITSNEHVTQEIAERFAGHLDPQLLAIETSKALQKPLPGSAYEYLIRAMALIYRFDDGSWREATAYLGQALRVDPECGRTWAFSAMGRILGVARGWSKDARRDLAAATNEAARAIACDPHDSLALSIIGHAIVFRNHQFDVALDLFDRAIRANPSCGYSWGYSALTFAYLGQINEAKRRLAHAQSTLIHEPFRSFLVGADGVIAYFGQEWERAIAISRAAVGLCPGLVNPRKHVASALCFLGRFEEAAIEHAEITKLEPDFTWENHLIQYPFGRSKDRLDLGVVLKQARLLNKPAA